MIGFTFISVFAHLSMWFKVVSVYSEMVQEVNSFEEKK